jgi:F-type H+-transporting ATPase subunit delta
VAEANSTTIASVSGLTGRYATALFELARDGRVLDAVDTDLATFGAAVATSPELASVMTSPRLSRSDAGKVIQSVAGSLGLNALTTKFLGTLAGNRRLATFDGIRSAFATLMAAHRGESTAIVTSAHPLSADQLAALKAKLKAGLARDVAVQTKVDPTILGGLIVKIGSRLIDSSLKTKLDALASQMKA